MHTGVQKHGFALMGKGGEVGMIVITTIDALPDHCYECPCHDSDGYCQADKEVRCSDWRPYWCPLKEIHDDRTGGEVEMTVLIISIIALTISILNLIRDILGR